MDSELQPLATYPLNLPTIRFEAAEQNPELIANNLQLYGALAYAAYRPRPKSNRLEQAVKASFVGRITTPKASVDAFCIPDAGDAILAFRGSNRLAHWQGNLRADWVDEAWGDQPAGDVHRGFHVAVEAVRSHCAGLLDACREMVGNRLKRITLVGHSRGGAIAVLFAPELTLTAGGEEIQVYTFGAPRVGSWKFSRAFAELPILHWRCEILGDPIPVLGFLGMHTGHLARIEPLPENRLILKRTEEAPLRRLLTTKYKPIDILEAHGARYYLRAVRDLTKPRPNPNEKAAK